MYIYSIIWTNVALQKDMEHCDILKSSVTFYTKDTLLLNI